MARAEDQDIPEELQEDYDKTFAPTIYDLNGYAEHPDARDLIRSRTPLSRLGIRKPSINQLSQRAIFKVASEWYGNAPEQERAAYFQAATGSGLWHYNFYMQRAILEIIDGATELEFRRPQALHYDFDAAADCAYALIEGVEGEGYYFTADVETEPSTDHDCGFTSRLFRQQFMVYRKYWTGLNWYYVYNYWQDLQGTARTRRTFNVDAPALPGAIWCARVHREGSEQVPFIIWRLDADGQQPNLQLSGFTAIA